MIEQRIADAYRFFRSRGGSPAHALKAAREELDGTPATYRIKLAPRRFGEYARDPVKHQKLFTDKPESIGLRFVGFSDDIIRGIQHCGWYADSFQESTYRGAVFQLPGRKGASRFVAAYRESDSGGYVVDLSPGAVQSENSRDMDGYALDVKDFAACSEAAYLADGFAEREAEEAREYSEAWQAGADWSALGDVIKSARSEALEILRERRKVPKVEAPALCAAIRAQVSRLCDEIEQARAKRKELRDSVWRDHYAAFNEGAGRNVLA